MPPEKITITVLTEEEKKFLEGQAKESVIEARAGLVLGQGAQMAFFAALSFKLRPIPDWTIPTAATDGKYLIYNPAFWMGLNRKEAVGVFAHEVMHPALQHHTRRQTRDPEKWNIAGDLVINQLLKEAGCTLPHGALYPEHFKLPLNLTTEEYYDKLPALAFGQVSDGEGGNGNDPGGCGGVMDAGDEAATVASEAEWKIEVAKAAAMAKQRCTLPGNILRLVEELLAPVVDWKHVLREFVTKEAKNDFSWLPPNRRFIHQGMYLPSLRSEELGEVLAAFDTSGSIGQDEMTRFASELQGILEAFPACKLKILYHDTQVAGEQDWEPSDGPLKLEPKGGGGTSHICVFDYIREHALDPACLVCLTDLYSEFPAMPPEYPVLWAYPEGQSGTAPWGQSVEIAG